ncbi:MAG: translation initiation factor IF-2 [Planctomycetota bacterium]|jgi:translation initiation factor IF-2
MSAMKPVKLIKASKTFNVGLSTLADFLCTKGFEVEAKPIAKLDEEMYGLLLAEFGDDKDRRESANKLQLGNKGKNVSLQLTKDGTTKEVDLDKKKEPSPVVEKVVETVKVEIEQPKIVGNIDLEKKEEVVVPEPVVEEVKPVIKEKTEPVVAETIKAELTGPKVLGRIELPVTKKPSPKKPVPKAAKKVEVPKKPIVQKVEAPKAPVVQRAPEVEKPKEKALKQEDFLATKRVTLAGAKVLGKIEIKEEPKKKEKAKPVKRVRQRIRKPAKIDPKREFKRRVTGPAAKKPKKAEPTIVTQKEIEAKLKATMAKLSGSSGSKTRQKLRKAKRQEHAVAEDIKQAQEGEAAAILKVTEFITVSDLAVMLEVSATEIITKCFMLGVMVSINQRLEADVIELIATEYDRDIEFISVEDQEAFEDSEDAEEDLVSRAPVVTIMGHVDHGKTSLLDYIRKAKVADKEAGGITQHIGAYEVEVEKGKITFLDTPGHEAFTAMRARGTKLTDIAVIVIAADDDIQPQTKESISHAQSAGVPMIFAINKIDKPGANPDKIKASLSEMNLVVEEWGGKFQSQEISAKMGTNIDELLEKIILEAELLDLKANPDKAGFGSIVESSLDKGRGYVATLLNQAGTLKVGDFVVSGSNSGKVKALYDHTGSKVNQAFPAQPVQMLGLNGAPLAGERFKVFKSEQEGKAYANSRDILEREHGMRTQKHMTLDEIGRRLALGTFKELNLIVKGDVGGSIEALSDSLQKLSTEEIQVNILHKAVGAITESDVMLASASNAVILGFQVRPTTKSRLLAENEGVEIRMYSVIYKAIEELQDAMEGMLEPTTKEIITGNLEVKETFKITKVGTIAGCIVTDGKVKASNRIRLIRDGIVKYSGELKSLKRYKDNVKDVVTGQDCGIQMKDYNDINVGDVIESYEEIEIKRTLKK